MTESERAKELGLVSLEEAIRETGTNRDYLRRLWRTAKRKRVFDLICKGVLAEKHSKQISKQ